MKFILDTNVISEYTRKEPVRAVLDWLERIPETELYISALTLGEIKQGIEKLPAGRKRGDLLLWFERLRDSFHDHILPVDERVALRWGELSARAGKMGIQLHVIDTLIGATALSHNAVLITRNTRDFQALDIDLVNPWA